jgi:hypothetical protein
LKPCSMALLPTAIMNSFPTAVKLPSLSFLISA